MVDENPNGSSPTGAAPSLPAQPQRRKPSWPLIVLAVLFVVVPFLTWYLTWFGRPLSEADIARYLEDQKNVRGVQQALTQVEERMEKGDPSARRWYPQIIALADSPVVEIRKTVAWVMGQDNTSEEFHAGLVKLVGDPHPAVRRNAAVQLVRFRDERGKGELRAMLQPYTVTAQTPGRIESVLTEGVEVRENALLARITSAENPVQELRSPLSGKLIKVLAAQGQHVALDHPVLLLGPDPEFVYESLRALFLLGTEEDLPDVLRYAEGVDGMPERVKLQAAQTANAIRNRSGKKDSEVKPQQPERQ